MLDEDVEPATGVNWSPRHAPRIAARRRSGSLRMLLGALALAVAAVFGSGAIALTPARAESRLSDPRLAVARPHRRAAAVAPGRRLPPVPAAIRTVEPALETAAVTPPTPPPP